MIKQEAVLSKESRKFLDDLHVYLFSSGKNEKETNEIIEELKDHLIEAEKNGKSIEHIIGISPKSYMEQLSKEMSVDYKSWFKYIPLMILGVFSIIIIGDVFDGPLSYSLLEILGSIGISSLFLAGISFTFRYISANQLSTVNELIIFALVGGMPIGLFIGLIFLDRAVSTPTISFGITGTIIIAVVTTIFLIAFSYWAKTWILLVIPAFFSLPDFLLGYTTMVESTRLIIGTLITYGGIAVYILLSNRKRKT
ncbi:HAAS domain-containing protein [Oceanobacillus rekensis]|uniref:HAAS domain-containing protein n=1 Tax=Oceanobacillus rekensis TaxID=937927 RepID=UPI000B454782|nr:DUF1129 family protein [Oceanobacillus rekensis]